MTEEVGLGAHHIDLSGSEPDQLRLIRSIVAMANSGGGRIVVHPKAPAGPSDVLEAATLEAAVNGYVAPRLSHLHCEPAPQRAVIVTVPDSPAGPHVFTCDGSTESEQTGDGEEVTAVFHCGQIWVRRGAREQPASAEDVQRMIRAAASQFLERLSIGIRDPAFSLRLSNSEGIPVRLAGDEEAVPVSPNLDRLYPYTTKTMGESLGKSLNWAAIAIKVLRLKADREYAYGVPSPTGRIVQWRYSEKAYELLGARLAEDPAWDPYHV